MVLLNYTMLSNFGFKVLKILQLNEYNNKKTFKYFLGSYFWLALLCSGVGFITIHLFTIGMETNSVSVTYAYILLACYMFLMLFSSLDSGGEFPKFTKRLMRLFVTASIILIAGFCLLTMLTHDYPSISYSIITLMPIVGYLLIFVLNFCLLPIEKLIKRGYIRKTKDMLKQRDDMIIIGITGSFGKTSTKNFLDRILSEKYVVLATPKNYNTPMGVSKTVLEKMTINQEIFIVEMGAYRRGDIAELCDIVHPQIGVLTSIGAQHMESFKSQQNIYDTKTELINSLPDSGTAFFNLDNEYCLKAFDECKVKKVGVSTDEKYLGRQDVIVAQKIKVDETGINFIVNLRGEKEKFTLKVLGNHNVTNVLLAIAVAVELGLSNTQIRRGVAKIRPVTHRLELKSLPTGDLLIDDAYNSNPEGFKNALNTLATFNRKKIVVTPGIIDLGDSGKMINREMGREMGKVADHIILVKETNKTALLGGIRESGFDEKNLVLVNSFKDAKKEYSKLLDGKSVVLLENDLPENYM